MKFSYAARFPALYQCSLFRDLDTEDVEAILGACHINTYEPTDAIFRQGDWLSGLTIIASGRAEIGFIDEDGNQSIIYLSGPPDVLGAVETIAERQALASCIAVTPVTVFHCPTAQLKLHIENPLILRNIAGDFYMRLSRDNHDKAVMQSYTVEQRICSQLYRMSEDNRVIQISQSYLSDIVGCSRQSTNKELAALSDAGMIRKAKGAILVSDRDALLHRIEEIAVTI